LDARSGEVVSRRIALRAEVLPGAVFAGIGMVLALIWRESGLPNWYDIIGFVGMLPAGMLGGHLARQRQRGRRLEQTDLSRHDAGRTALGNEP
jgi:hypothetical protein